MLPAAALLVGCWLHMGQEQLWPAQQLAWTVASAALALFALAWVRAQLPAGSRRLRATRALLGACALAELAFGLAGCRAWPRLRDRLEPQLWTSQLRVTGVVQDLPASTASGLRFVLATRDGPSGLPSHLLVSWSAPAGPPARLRAGQAWSLPLRLRPPQGLANPAGFDTEEWLFRQGLGATAMVLPARSLGPARRLPDLDRATPWQRIQALREGARQRIRDALRGHARAGSLAALALGDQAAPGPDEWQIYRATGVAHLMAISGLHITMQAWLAGLLCSALWRRLRWRGVPLCLRVPTPVPVGAARLLAAMGYGAASGLGVPAQRAVLMLAVALLARLGARRLGWTQVLGLALCAVLLWDPWAVAQPGLWLSFGAVAALLLTEAGLPAPPAGQSRARLVWQRLRSAARAQWTVSLALAPLTLVFFQQVSLVSPLANALAIPVVTLVVVPLAVGGLLLPPPLDAWAWRVAAEVQDGLLGALAPLAAWPLAQWHAPSPGPGALALLSVGIVALVLPWPWRMRLAGAAVLGLVLAVPAQRPAHGHLQAWLLDVGQGSAVVLRTRRHTMVFDAGPPMGGSQDAGGRVVLPLLRQLGERRLDLVALSHADSDHTGGAASLARAYPGTPAQGSVAPSRLLGWGFASAGRCLEGQGWEWDGVRFEWLYPGPGGDLREGNAGSCVLRVQAGTGSLLLTGDLERAGEVELLRRPDAARRLRSDLLVAGHHGSRGSSHDAFLDAVAPRVVAVQAGFLNRYGHPHDVLLRRLRARDLPLSRTDRDGALLWRDEQPGRLCPWRVTHRRYWQLEMPPGGPARTLE
ncbi:MAG: DNA internalization-related competence protein ComEC/Rec2 [Betaproteobacteria bacterium]|nr:DNA internalization-related competence protein ComEC/Rec2 [Betaproteobacteria bacterium]